MKRILSKGCRPLKKEVVPSEKIFETMAAKMTQSGNGGYLTL